jgi:predicted RNA-binding protein with TRAM domain
VPLKERAEAEIEIHETAQADEGDPRNFVGFITDAPEGVPPAAEHDEYLRQDGKHD